jgi:hypothetical protein
MSHQRSHLRVNSAGAYRFCLRSALMMQILLCVSNSCVVLAQETWTSPGARLDKLEKIDPELRKKAYTADRIPVLILLQRQPHKAIVKNIREHHRERLTNAEEKYSELVRRPFSLEYEVRDAAAELDSVTREIREQASAEIGEAVRPSQDDLEVRLIALGASGIRRYTVLNMLRAEIPAWSIAMLESDPSIAEVSLVASHQTQAETFHPGTNILAIGAPAFWDGSSPYNLIPGPFYGLGSSIGVIDTGVKTSHPFFRDVPIVSHQELAGGSKNSCFHDNINSTDDLLGHGTHVASIAGSGDKTFPGVAPRLMTLYNLKAGYLCITNDAKGQPQSGGQFSEDDIFAELDWAKTKVTVFNFSGGSIVGPTSDDSPGARKFDLIADMWGISIAVSGGNEGLGADQQQKIGSLTSPGIAYNVISVANWDTGGASDNTHEEIEPNSSRGPTRGGRDKPDLAAPGTNIRAAKIPAGNTIMTGTSMAAPHVAGALALLKQFGITDPVQSKALLLNSADRSSDRWKPDAGWGFLNLRTLRTHAINSPRNGGFLSSISQFQLFSGPVNGDLDATIAWNRHFDKQQAPYLNHLELYAYDKATGSEQLVVNSSLDNVQHFSAKYVDTMVLKVKPKGKFTTPDNGLEEFGFAASQPFKAAYGPAFTPSCSGPATVKPGGSATITCDVQNSGDLPAFNVDVTLSAAPADIRHWADAEPGGVCRRQELLHSNQWEQLCGNCGSESGSDSPRPEGGGKRHAQPDYRLT